MDLYLLKAELENLFLEFNKLESVIVDLQMMSSSSSTTQVVSLRDMGMYESFQQLSGWENPFKSDINNITSNQNNNQSSSTTLDVDARPEADDNNRVRYSLFPESCFRFISVVCLVIDG